MEWRGGEKMINFSKKMLKFGLNTLQNTLQIDNKQKEKEK